MPWQDEYSKMCSCYHQILDRVAETQGQEEKVIRKALKEAYPFGERGMHPYKVWCSEVQKQRGTYKTKRQRNQEAVYAQVMQGELFPIASEPLPEMYTK